MEFDSIKRVSVKFGPGAALVYTHAETKCPYTLQYQIDEPFLPSCSLFLILF